MARKTVRRAILFLIVISLSAGMFTILWNRGYFHIQNPPLILDSTIYNDHHINFFGDKIANRVDQQPFNVAALIIFILAIIHTFCTHRFNELSDWLIERNSKRKGDYTETFLSEICRFMGEVEVVFGIWVIPLLMIMTHFFSWSTALEYLNSRDYTEPIFVVIIMALASTKPIMVLAEKILRLFATLGKEHIRAWWWSILTLGPLMGSFITEPAAMTISAILLGHQFYRYQPSKRLAYATLGLLFTNISVGGVMTNFAAPPVLMVSKAWEWSTPYMFEHFGIRAILGIFLANLIYFFIFRKEFQFMEKKRKKLSKNDKNENQQKIPFWIILTHIVFMLWVVVHSHYPVVFIGAFLLFLGFHRATQIYQTELTLKIPILVGLFLAGLVIHGGLQAWWISPLLQNTTESSLFFLSTFLTSFNDNAAVTFLATLIPSLSDSLKHAVMSGAITGGGLTIIANAPNPAGGAILGEHFEHGISFFGLLLGALIPTCVMGILFYLGACCIY